jgi:hypothetical protein
MIASSGWVIAMLALAASPRRTACRAFRRDGAVPAAASGRRRGARRSSSSFWLIVGSFFVCGFRVSFLVTHMPGAIGCAVFRQCSPASGWPWWQSTSWAASSRARHSRLSMSRTLSVLYARGSVILTFLCSIITVAFDGSFLPTLCRPARGL